MTRDYDDYKANKDRHKTFRIIMKVVEIILIVGCVLVGLFFLLMVTFPKGLWVDLFK